MIFSIASDFFYKIYDKLQQVLSTFVKGVLVMESVFSVVWYIGNKGANSKI